MPEAIPLPDAAALYFPFHLAWLGLFDRADLKSGETVLIHAAAGGSGSAAIQLAVHRGARVIATAGGPEKVALCRELGAHVAIDYRAQDFAPIVLEETGGPRRRRRVRQRRRGRVRVVGQVHRLQRAAT
jgi:NADPH2:quinone reductase